MSNVLVYFGPGVSSSALHHTLHTLQTLLPTYDVQTVSAKTLALDPWQQTTSLLVLPGGSDLPYVEELSRTHYRADLSASSSSDAGVKAYEKVAAFVKEQGGNFCGICAGAYYASTHCAFELGTPIQVDGARPFLEFFPGTCSGTVYPGFVYESDKEARIVDLDLAKFLAKDQNAEEQSRWRCHYNGGGAFIDADSFRDQGVEVLARYTAPGAVELELDIDLNADANEQEVPPREGPARQLVSRKPVFAGQAASVLCSVGKGKALLFGTHPEFPLLPSSQAVQLSASKEWLVGPDSQDASEAHRKRHELLQHERRRLRWLRDTFVKKLGLRAELPDWVAETDKAAASSSSSSAAQETGEPKLLPVILTSTDAVSMAAMLDALRQVAAKSSAVVSHLSTATVDEGAAPERDFICSFKDSNDSIHLYKATAETTERLFSLCRTAPYDAFSRPVLLSDKDVAVNGSAGSAATDKEAKPQEQQEQEVDFDSVPKYLLCYDRDAELPTEELLPYWDISQYRQHLARFGEAVKRLESEDGNWAKWQRNDGDRGGGGMAHFFGGGWAGPGSSGGGDMSDTSSIRIGQTTLYGQMVTSTQTMFDKNFRFLSTLPVGTTFFATQQMSGRGREGNRWISPKGCLQFSSVFKVPLQLAAKTVFLQYLSAMAIVEGIRIALGPSLAGREVANKVRIKWPNDVYAEVAIEDNEGSSAGPTPSPTAARTATFDHDGKRYAKMAGILVNSQFSGGKEFVLIAGCGINCLNSRPTTSLLELVQLHNRRCTKAEDVLEEVSQEKLAAAILAVFESMWKTFLTNGGEFGPFVERYRAMWLHSDQEVVLGADALDGEGEKVGGGEGGEEGFKVRIVGISSDHGLLRAVKLESMLSTWDERAWASSEQGRGYRADEAVELQPDGNSFDMLKNMVKRKA